MASDPFYCDVAMTDTLLARLRELVTITRMDEQGRLRLPPERELATHFGLQRSSLREHLATLEHLGFIERTQGRGTFLKMPKPDFVQLYFDLALQLNYVSVEALESAREMMEREIVQQAARLAEDRDVAALSALRDRIKNATSIEEGITADYEFHEQLAWMTRNPVIMMLFQGLASVLKQVLHHRRVLVRRSSDSADQTNATHDAIVEALKARNPEAARQAMSAHFEIWNEQSLRIQSLRSAPGEPTAPQD